MSKLFGKKPLVLDKDLAKIIGLNEAIVIQQIHYWIEINKSKNINFYEDKHWTYNAMSDWQEEFPFWSIGLPEISTEINNKKYNKSISQSNNSIGNSNKEIKEMKEMKQERPTKDRSNFNDFNSRYKKIMAESYIDYIDESYREAVKQAIRLLVIDGINKDKINIAGNLIPKSLFNMDIEKINQFVIEHAIK